MQTSLLGLMFSLPPLVGVFLAAIIISRYVPFYRRLTLPQKGRYGDIDGLRGFLAVGVFLHHSGINYIMYTTGRWEVPDPTVLQFAGRGSVAFFFMITGFLFWTKAINARVGIAFAPFVVSRLRRLMPAYLLSFAAIWLIAFWKSGFTFHEPLSRLIIEAGRWLLGGLAGAPPINGQDTLTFNAGVTWTLRYEWIFYLLLPMLAIFARSLARFAWLALAAIALITALILTHSADRNEAATAYCFIWGMLAAHLFRMNRIRQLAAHPAFPVAAIVLTLVAIFGLKHILYTVAMVLCFPLFMGVLYHRVLPTLLQSRVALFLGHISYSIYLLHGIVLFLSIDLLSRILSLKQISPLMFSAIDSIIAVLMIIAAACSYRIAEHPWLSSPKPKVPAVAAPESVAAGDLLKAAEPVSAERS